MSRSFDGTYDMAKIITIDTLVLVSQSVSDVDRLPTFQQDLTLTESVKDLE